MFFLRVNEKGEFYYTKDNVVFDLNEFDGWQKEDYLNAGVPFIEPMGAKEVMEKELDKLFNHEDYFVDQKLDGCFSGDSLVLMSDNTYKCIKDIKKGDLVKSYNEQFRLLEDKQVVNVFRNGYTDDWLDITIECGDLKRVIRCTPNHKFYIKGEYIEASKLKEGDLLNLFY